jgi:hypothetical protein
LNVFQKKLEIEVRQGNLFGRVDELASGSIEADVLLCVVCANLRSVVAGEVSSFLKFPLSMGV